MENQDIRTMDFCGTEVAVWEDTTDIAKIDQAISDVNARIKEMKKGGILEHEKPLLENLREQEAALKGKRKSYYARKSCKYPAIDMSFLSKGRAEVSTTYRRGMKTPVFGVFRVFPGKWKRFAFCSSRNSYGRTDKRKSRAEWRIDQSSGKNRGNGVWILPEIFHQHFNKIAHTDTSGHFSDEHRAVSTTFASAVPLGVKAEITKAKKIFGKELFFVSEVPRERWENDEVPPPPDPLVIGVIGDTAYLVAKFDTTPVEDYVSREFTSGPLPQAKKVEDDDD